jgi:hypothetical protein
MMKTKKITNLFNRILKKHIPSWDSQVGIPKLGFPTVLFH